MRRSEKEINDRGRLYEILDRSQVCRIALHDDPYPYIVPVNHVRVGDKLYFHGAFEGHKMELMDRDPRVRFEVDRLVTVTGGDTACRWGATFESVIGVGLARVVEAPAEKETALESLMEKHSGRRDWEFTAAQLEAVAVVRIDIEDLSGKTTPGGNFA